MQVMTVYRCVCVCTAGVVTLIAGGEEVGTGDGDGIGADARFHIAWSVLCTRDGSKLFVADHGRRCIRMIRTANNQVSTIAGSGGAGDTDGPALSAELSTLQAMTFDPFTDIPESVLPDGRL